MDSSAPPSFLCPINQEIMRDPVTCADGHSYERASIELWLATHNTSPKTGAQLPNNALNPNHALRNAIEEWLSANFKLVPRSAVTFDEHALAHGSFKSVHRGTLQGRSEPIAVSRMRMGGSCEEEAKKLVKLGRHPDLVRYLGLCTEGPEQLLLTELAPHGSLDQFLGAHEGQVTLPHKLKMLAQVCSGMIAISGMAMIHRDLATRNILVFAFEASIPAATRVKITDFGLSVDRLYQTHAYGAQNEDVPFRWMPPEALKKRRFSEKSDVWAFGVTAWELLTDGEVPYGFIASNEAVAERVCGGERLTRPGECPDALWALLQRIWAERPADRPTFVEVAEALVVLSSACPEASALRRTTELAIPEHAMRLQRELHVEAEQEAGAREFERSIASLDRQRDVASIVRGMQKFGADKAVQKATCLALLNLTPSVVGDEWQKIRREDGEAWAQMRREYRALASAGVIDVVCRAISAHSEEVACVGCRILGLLARDDENQRKIYAQVVLTHEHMRIYVPSQ
jgi:serine/threonine protein kinase